MNIRKVASVSILAILVIITVVVVTIVRALNWSHRYEKQFDRFFGNWALVAYGRVDGGIYGYDFEDDLTHAELFGNPIKYRTYYIGCLSDDNVDFVYRISDMAYRVDSSKYSKDQILIRELYECARYKAQSEIRDVVLADLNLDDTYVDVRLLSDRLNGDFYDWLWLQDWFNIDDITPDDLLSLHQYGYNIEVEYVVDKSVLSSEEMNELQDVCKSTESRLVNLYGDDIVLTTRVSDGQSVLYESQYGVTE